jgi:hypothetical protein
LGHKVLQMFRTIVLQWYDSMKHDARQQSVNSG